MQDKLLTILILSSNRLDLLRATINSLTETMTYPHWEMIVYNHDGTIGEGWNELIKKINGDYVLSCQDDWYFIEKWNWVEKAIDILNREKEVGIVRLRKDSDGQHPTKEIRKIGDGSIVECVAGGFTMNPFIAKAELFKDLGNADERKIKGIAEISLREKYREKKYLTAKLNNPAKGVTIHIGRGRRVFGEET